jgi:hypothetical protein
MKRKPIPFYAHNTWIVADKKTIKEEDGIPVITNVNGVVKFNGPRRIKVIPMFSNREFAENFATSVEGSGAALVPGPRNLLLLLIAQYAKGATHTVANPLVGQKDVLVSKIQKVIRELEEIIKNEDEKERS